MSSSCRLAVLCTMLFTTVVSLAAPLGDLERLRPLTRRAALLGLGASIATSGSQRPVFALELDPDYPGTAVERMQAVRQRAASLTPSELSRDWSSFVRPRLLWAAGMRDVRDAAPGQGYTGHAFNDAIHVDATAMLDGDALNDGRVRGVAIGNRLGPGIVAASLTELGPGGSWSTCQATSSPLSSPRPAEDSGVAHLQVTPSPHRRIAAPPRRRAAAPPRRRAAALAALAALRAATGTRRAPPLAVSLAHRVQARLGARRLQPFRAGRRRRPLARDGRANGPSARARGAPGQLRHGGQLQVRSRGRADGALGGRASTYAAPLPRCCSSVGGGC